MPTIILIYDTIQSQSKQLNGVSITTVAGQLGHADSTTTAKIYAHAIKSAQAAAADMMEDLLGQGAYDKKVK